MSVSKTVHWFRPNLHWNVVSREVFHVLLKFYDQPDRLKVTLEKS